MSQELSTPSRHLPLFESGEELKLRTWVQLARTFYLIQRRVVAMLGRHELTLPQFDILATLRFSEGVTQQELAERLLVTKGNVCGVLDRLEGMGWVERRPDAKDRRVNRLHLTSAGRTKIDAVFPDHNALIVQLMQTFPAGEVKLLRGLLEQLERAESTLG